MKTTTLFLFLVSFVVSSMALTKHFFFTEEAPTEVTLTTHAQVVMKDQEHFTICFKNDFSMTLCKPVLNENLKEELASFGEQVAFKNFKSLTPAEGIYKFEKIVPIAQEPDFAAGYECSKNCS